MNAQIPVIKVVMKNTKYIIIVLLFVLVSGCSSGNNTPKIGVLFGNFKSKTWKLEKKFLEAKIKSLGAIPIIKIAYGDELKQIKQADSLIKEHIDALIIAPINENNSGMIVRKAKKKNIKVISIYGLTRNADIDYYIIQNTTKVGNFMAQYAIQHVPEGNYVILLGKRNKNMLNLQKGIYQVLHSHIQQKKIDIVFQLFLDSWQQSEAYHYTNKVIQFSDKKINVLMASYSGFCYGALKAAIANNEKNMLIVGFGADKYSVKSILKGKDILVIYRSPKKIAEKIAETAVYSALNKKIAYQDSTFNGKKYVPTIKIDPVIINKNNVQKYIFDEGYLTKSEVLK